MGTKNYNNYSDMITFTRASTGTYLDSDGLLKSAATNTPRVEYDYQGNRLGLLVEEARTNDVTYSEDFTTSWGLTNATIISGAAVAPDGLNTAFKLVPNVGLHSYSSIGKAIGSVTSSAYTITIFAKAAGKTFCALLDAQGNKLVYFNLASGTVETVHPLTNSSIQNVGNGWYRLSVTSTVTFRNCFIRVTDSGSSSSVTGDGISGIYIWGAQVEAGSFPTSYIPTVLSTVTRAADVATIGVGAFGYNAQGGTVVVTADWYPGSNFLVSNRAALEIGDGGVSERLLIYNHDGFAGRGFMKGVLFGDQTGSGARITDDQAKVALVFADANQAHCVDGGSIDTGSAAMLAGTTIMKIGPTLRTGHISSIAYYPRRLTDAQIKALTSPPETPTLSLTFDDSTTSYLETSIHG